MPRRTRRELDGGGIGRAVVAEEGADHGAWGIGETERESERERERGGDRNIRVFFEKLGNVRVRGMGGANRTGLSLSLLGLIIFWVRGLI